MDLETGDCEKNFPIIFRPVRDRFFIAFMSIRQRSSLSFFLLVRDMIETRCET